MSEHVVHSKGRYCEIFVANFYFYLYLHYKLGHNVKSVSYSESQTKKATAVHNDSNPVAFV